mgnify:CR=1 FL=1
MPFTSMYSPARSAVTGDDQLGQIPKRRIQQSADCITGLFGDGFGCMTKQGGKRNDCENCEHKQERMGGWHNLGLRSARLGTNISIQSNGVSRISLSRGFMVLAAPGNRSRPRAFRLLPAGRSQRASGARQIVAAHSS